jgi:hypothetical protein
MVRKDMVCRRGEWSEEILQEPEIRIQSGGLGKRRQNDIMGSLRGVSVAELQLRTLKTPGFGPQGALGPANEKR